MEEVQYRRDGSHGLAPDFNPVSRVVSYTGSMIGPNGEDLSFNLTDDDIGHQ